MGKSRIIQRSRRIGKSHAAALTARANALEARLVSSISKHALAEAVATKAIVSGLVSGASPAQVEADLMAELRRYEEAAALRRFGRGDQTRLKS